MKTYACNNQKDTLMKIIPIACVNCRNRDMVSSSHIRHPPKNPRSPDRLTSRTPPSPQHTLLESIIALLQVIDEEV